MSARSLRAWLRSFHGHDFITLYIMGQISQEELKEGAEEFGMSLPAFLRILHEKAFGRSKPWLVSSW